MKEKLKQLQELLIDRLIDDLQNPEKQTPGLYTVVRGILTDHKEKVGAIPSEAIEAVEAAMAEKVPFKLKKAVY